MRKTSERQLRDLVTLINSSGANGATAYTLHHVHGYAVEVMADACMRGLLELVPGCAPTSARLRVSETGKVWVLQ
jgi:hypothetical protein